MYLSRYRQFLTLGKRRLLYLLIAAMSLSILLTGSKIFIMLLGLGLFIVYLYEEYKLRLGKLIVLTILGLCLMGVSFVVSIVVKYKEPQGIANLVHQVGEEVRV